MKRFCATVLVLTKPAATKADTLTLTGANFDSRDSDIRLDPRHYPEC